MRALLALLLGVAALAAAAPAALADADPPSDVLLLQDVYYPYQPPVADKLRRTLDKVVLDAKKAGYPVKVAMVESAVDLGAIPQLFGKPAQYAPFLGREIAFKSKDPLLVIMPAGIATNNVSPNAQRAIQGIKVDPSKQSNGLVAAAIEAVPKMATASGHPVASVPVPSAGSGKNGGGARRRSSSSARRCCSWRWPRSWPPCAGGARTKRTTTRTSRRPPKRRRELSFRRTLRL